MSYSMPIPLVYTNSTVVDFGDSPTAWSFKGPSGKQGMLKNIGIHVTEVFSGDQVTGKVLVGTTADPNYYGQLEIADGTAATDTYNDQDDSGLTTNFDQPGLTDGGSGNLPNDRRHSLKLNGAYQVIENLTIGANFNFQTGRPRPIPGRPTYTLVVAATTR